MPPRSSVRRSSPSPLQVSKPSERDTTMSQNSKQTQRSLLEIVKEAEKAVSSDVLCDPIVTEATLSRLGFSRGAPLPRLETKKDEDAEVTDPETLFFEPYPNDEVYRIVRAVQNEMQTNPNRHELICCTREHHSLSCTVWAWNYYEDLFAWPEWPVLAMWSGPGSPRPCAVAEHGELPIFMGYPDRLDVYGDVPYGQTPKWMMVNSAWLADKPHVRCAVMDSTAVQLGSDEVLRSELVTALAVMRHQMTCNGFENSIVPVLVLSFGHTTVVRVTQIHLDPASRKFIIRQAPLLFIGAKSGNKNDRTTEERMAIYTVFQWIECGPLGLE